MVSATTKTGRRRSEKLVHSKLAVAIRIERLQRGGRVGDFIRINDPVPVRIERLHEWRGRVMGPHSGAAGRTAIRRR